MRLSLKKIVSFILLLATLWLTSPLAASAQDQLDACRSQYDPKQGLGMVLKRVGCVAGFFSPGSEVDQTQESVAAIIGNFINIALGFTGVIFVIIIIYGGWLWGSATGNEEQVTHAERLIYNAVIGVIITFAAFAISNFVIYQVVGGALTPQTY